MAVNSSIEQQFQKKLTELTEANLANEQFGVSELAQEMGMSRSNLHRKVITNFRIGYDKKTAGFSVRCIKNKFSILIKN